MEDAALHFFSFWQSSCVAAPYSSQEYSYAYGYNDHAHTAIMRRCAHQKFHKGGWYLTDQLLQDPIQHANLHFSGERLSGQTSVCRIMMRYLISLPEKAPPFNTFIRPIQGYRIWC